MTEHAASVAAPRAPRAPSFPGPWTRSGPRTPARGTDEATALTGLRSWAALLASFVSRAYLAFVATLLAIAVLPALGPWSSFVVRSDSMQPHIARGDVVVASPFSAESTRVPVGRVMVFENPVAAPGTTAPTILVHRVVRHNHDGTYTTRGDHNRVADSTHVTKTAFFGRARLLVPKIGLPLVWWWGHQWVPLGIWLLLTALAVWFGLRRMVPAEGPDRDRAPDASERRPARPRDDAAQNRPWSGRVARGALLGLVLVSTVVAVSRFGGANAAFSAEARNPGNSWRVATLPGLPTDVAADQTGPGSATLTWAAPVNGGTVTGYVVRLDDVEVARVGAATYHYDVSGLSAGTHTLAVSTFNGLGQSAQAATAVTIVAAPGAPTSPAATQTGAGTATFTWAAPTDGGAVTTYLVYLDGTKVATVGSGTLRYDASGLSAATHTFAVSASNSVGESSRASTTLTILVVPWAPTSPAATQTGVGAAAFTWNAATGGPAPTGYRVSVDGTLVSTVDASTFATSATGLTAAAHTLAVTAVNAGGESAPASTTFTILPAPDVPQSPAATQTAAGAATFTWAAPAAGATPTGYHVYLDGTLVSTVGASTFSDSRSSLTTGSHTFAVTAYNAIGDSPAATATVEIVTAPGTPTSTTIAQTGAGTALFTWAAPTSGGTPAGYYVYVDTVKVATVSAATLSYTATGLTAASHTIAVSTFNAMGESSKASRSITIVAAPGPPRSLSVSNVGTGRIRITWSAPNTGGTVAGYRIYRSTTNNVATATLLKDGLTTRSYTDATAVVGTTYYYWVSAYNVAGESALTYAGSARG